ncbi:AraC family transcriptional regulator [Streptomyces sp. B1866]|uniref:AraC family transcriptional regulator n=1 Tax=Streptomyces sp. B1866 TaxID=3075431 RepID=UPI00289220B5|nr:AraC family transcriptional regulator [Streptomyces sp. B1866]MDT3400491.1 AraC family transcriptional regulator [Streptomyces sp. B1866]
MDVLSDALAAMRTGRPHAGRTERSGAWGTRFPDADGAGFHVVLQGSCWLLPHDGEPVPLGPGDVVLLPHGRRHGLADSPGTPLTDFAAPPSGPFPSDPPDEGRPPHPRTVLLCGAYRLDTVRAHPLLRDLPEVVHMPARLGPHPRLHTAVQLLGAELERPRPGAGALLTSLLDVLLLYVLRAWYEEESGSGHAGWAAALHDPAVSAALRALHRDPAHPWTVESLGRVAGLSRAAFARRFTALVGQPPLGYLTWWRMTLAARLLRDTGLPLRAVADRSGYASEFAFAKAFKREYGAAPGAYRAAGTDPAGRGAA